MNKKKKEMLVRLFIYMGVGIVYSVLILIGFILEPSVMNALYLFYIVFVAFLLGGVFFYYVFLSNFNLDIGFLEKFEESKER